MDQLFIKVRDVDPNNSDAVKDVLSTFFQSLQKRRDYNCIRWLRELLKIINRYPKYCMSYRNIIETFLSTFLSSNNYYNVIEAAKCAHALQQVRPVQEKTATPKSRWRDQMSLLCNAAHSLIEVIFSDAVDIYKSNTNINNKPEDPKTNSPLSSALTNIKKKLHDTKDRSLLLQTRLKNVLVFIQAMLVDTYPIPKPIQPRTIIDVIVRTLSVSNKQDDIDVASVKIQALKTMDALILCLGSNLIPYSPLVFRLVTQTLRWTSENLSNTTGKVRCTAYSSLSNWLITLHVYKMPDKSTWEDDLTAHIIKDITPAKKVVALTMGPPPTKNLSKKAKRKLANSQLLESSIAVHMPGEKNKINISDEMNNEVIIAALECAEVFLTVCGRFLKPVTHKLFQERGVRHYMHTDTLKYLRVLEAARKTTPPNVPPPTQYCLHLYSQLVNSSCAEISKFCTQALLDIRLHLHCSPPSINFAIEIPQESEETNNKRKKVSNRNRAVLEYLLGAEKVPQENREDDIISIPDEPINKKQRIDDDLDKISLSSGSVTTLKIMYESEISSESEDDKVIEVDCVVELNESNDKNKSNTEITNDIQTEIINEQTNDEINKNIIEEEMEPVIEEQEIQQNDIDNPDQIYEKRTQSLNVSNDTEDCHSMEVAYDFPNTGTNTVTVLEKIDDENLPSTNDTDDIQITCAQVVRNSQDIEVERNSQDIEVDRNSQNIEVKRNSQDIEVERNSQDIEVERNSQDIKVKRNSQDIEVENNEAKVDKPNVNGVDKTDNCHRNDVTDSKDKEEVKITSKADGVSVEDMLADFVDEVNEEITAA